MILWLAITAGWLTLALLSTLLVAGGTHKPTPEPFMPLDMLDDLARVA